MEKSTRQRWIFAFLSMIVMIIVMGHAPVIYGNDDASITKYIMAEYGLRLKDHVELLAVEDYGDERIVIFRRETKAPEDVMLLRLRKNADGNYEPYANAGLSMYHSRSGMGIWTDHLRGRRDDRQVLYVVWSENPQLARIESRFGIGDGKIEKTARITENPSLTIWEFTVPGSGFSVRTAFYDARGQELN